MLNTNWLIRGIGYGEDLLVCAALGVDMVCQLLLVSYRGLEREGDLTTQADCVFPTRTAVRGNLQRPHHRILHNLSVPFSSQRFGLALTFDGHLNLRLQKYARDFSVIDPDCPCPTCDKGNGVSRSYLHTLAGRETVGAHAITLHNIAYQVRKLA